jgi:hypothetical protein
MDARDRALARLTEMLTPAAALGIARCPFHTKNCPRERCRHRKDAARAELHQIVLTLFDLG